MTVPDKMQALITQANKTTKVETVPTPDIDDDEVLVKTVAIALNHTDWKRSSFSPCIPTLSIDAESIFSVRY